MKIIIAGGTGFIGTAVTERLLCERHEVIVLTRRPAGYLSVADKKVLTVSWDARTPGPWGAVLEEADVVINLSGETIAGGAWTKRRKQSLYEGRLSATQTIVRAIGACKTKPRVFINASAIGYYGDGQDRLLTEDSEKGEGFLADLCAAWEKAALKAEDYGVRTVLLRTGLVLDRGGFLDKMSAPFRFFIGGPLGSGRQWISWIWRRDLANAVIFFIDHSSLRGPVNCVSPEPVTMTEFCRALGKALRRPSWFPVPSFLIRAILGQISELVLKSQRVTPKKLLEAGFRYKMTTITEILTAIFVSNKKPRKTLKGIM
jgi:hypothetical protein